MKKRTVVRLISYLVALMFILSGVILKCYKEMQFYKNQVRFTNSAALEELTSSLSNINLNLEKAAYVTTAKQMNNIAITLYTEAKNAKNAFAQISSQNLNVESFNKFLSQVGNYSVHIARKVSNGEEISDLERENILKLGDISKNVSLGVSNMEQQYNNKGFWDKELSNKFNNALELSEMDTAFSQLDESFTDYPTLIYDGPYSDFSGNSEPIILSENSEIDIETASLRVAKLLNIDAAELKLDGTEAGKIETYRFVYDNGVAGISIKGGHLVYFRKYTTEGTAFFNYEQAISIAQKYLSRNSEEKFIPTYYYADNGVCTINFAYMNGSVICYTDLVKIGVDLSSGDVVLYEGRGYLTHHKNRSLPTPAHTLEEATKVLSSALKIQSTAIALIPTDGGYEKQCYEFLCLGQKNEKILIYVNTQTLAEEDILMMLETDGGTLVK